MATRQVKYIGQHKGGVFVPAFDADRDIKPGEVVEMDADLAKSLCEQTDNWEEVKAAPPKGKDDKQKGGDS